MLKILKILKIIIANLLNKNKKYANAIKIRGFTGTLYDGMAFYD